jgi:signal transduction histidine kinase
MSSRIRDFTSFQQQNEKMMALGKLSAGLAHELNNPATAIVRSSDSLMKHLSNTPESFKRVISLKLSDEQVDRVNDILFSKLTSPAPAKLTLRQKTELENDLLDWLEDRGIDDADEITDNLIEFGLAEEELNSIETILKGEQLEPVLLWINNVMTTERTVSDIHAASRRISELVHSIKSYSHMDRDQDKVKTDIRVGLEDTLNILVHKIKSGNVSVRESFEEELPEPAVSPGELNQVWTNIIDNAIDALEDTPSPSIEIKTHQNHDFVVVEIIDNGPGIPEDMIQSIFDPFFTTKDVGKGSGMGLDISMKIIQRHKGTLDVESNPGRTVFRVCLPIENKP